MTTWDGGKGYWAKVDQAVSFSFDLSSLGRTSYSNPINKAPIGMEYAQSMNQAFYFIEDIIVDGSPISYGDWVLAYKGSTLIGAREWNGQFTDLPAMGDDGEDLTSGYANSGDLVSIHVIDSETGTVYEISDRYEWTNNELYTLGILEATEIPVSVSLLDTYPNPFNPSTNISFTLSQDSYVELSAYDLSGRKSMDIFNGHLGAGVNQITWNALELSSGIYFINLTGEGINESVKVMYMK